MKSLNKVELIGRLGKDAETTFTTSGKAVTKFSVATETSYKKGNEVVKETNWTNCVQWNAEKLAPYLLKGTQLYVEGRLQSRSYDDKDGRKVYVTEVVVSDVILLSSNSSGRTQSAGADTWNDEDSGLPF